MFTNWNTMKRMNSHMEIHNELKLNDWKLNEWKLAELFNPWGTTGYTQL